MRKAAVVVDVQVSQHHGLHIAGTDAEASQLRPHLLLRLNVETDGKPKIRMPAWQGL